MTRVVIQPAGGPASRQHFEDTVQKPVPQDRLRPFLSPEEITALESAYGRNPMPIWGLTPSGRRAGKDAWSQMHPGGYRVVHRGNRVYSGGIVTYRVHNAALARELWREDRKGRTWEYVYFLKDMFDLSIPYGSLNRVLGYKSNFVPQGILVLDPVKSQEMIDTFRLTTALPPEAEVDEATSTIAESAGEPSLRQGYRLSPELRRAIETHAVPKGREVLLTPKRGLPCAGCISQGDAISCERNPSFPRGYPKGRDHNCFLSLGHRQRTAKTRRLRLLGATKCTLKRLSTRENSSRDKIRTAAARFFVRA